MLKRNEAFANRLTRRSRMIPWLGLIFVGAMVVFAAVDLRDGYHQTIRQTERELRNYSDLVAEHVAQRFRYVDLELAHIVETLNDDSSIAAAPGTANLLARHLQTASPVLRGITITEPDGAAIASTVQVADLAGVLTTSTRRSTRGAAEFDPSSGFPGSTVRIGDEWVIPVAQPIGVTNGVPGAWIIGWLRVESMVSGFAAVGTDNATLVTLMHDNGTLLARHPSLDSALGKAFPLLDHLLAVEPLTSTGTRRFFSPIDGVERFGAIRAVLAYPMTVAVTRDVAAAHALWREHAFGTVARTAFLAVLALLLMYQLARLAAVRDELESSKDRFLLAAAGSDDGIWEWDIASDTMYASARAREIFGHPEVAEIFPRKQLLEIVEIHPDDAPKRAAALEAHLSGKAPIYRADYRVRHRDGEYRWVRASAVCVRDANGKPFRMAGSASDIDAQRRAEEALRLSEERFALAAEGSNHGILDWDIVRDRMYTSERAMEIAGVSSTNTVRTRAEWLAMLKVHPDDIERHRKDLQSFLDSNNRLREGEYRVQRPDGMYRWIQLRMLCLRDAAGRAVRLAGSVSDIDSRKRAEDALRASEQRFALAVAGSNDGILDWDILADRMYASDRALHILGLVGEPNTCTQQEWSQKLQPRVHPDDTARMKRDFRDGSAAEQRGEYRVLGTDNRYHWVRIRARDINDESHRPIRWSGAITDIDGEKKSEEALRESEARYERAMTGSNEAHWDWNIQTGEQYVSPRLIEMLDMPADRSYRTREELMAEFPIHPEDIEPWRAAIDDHLAGKTTRFETDFRIVTRKGEVRWLHSRGQCFRDAAGQPLRLAGSTLDVTDRKRMEQDRERLEQQLHQAQKLEAIGTLAGGIAHDFNNILAAILGYGEMVQKEAPEGSALRRHIDASMSAAMRAKSLVERILAFSRSGIGERVPVHVQSIVNEALDQVAASLPAGVQLVRNLSAGNAAVLGDPTQVHQVIMNLCANAVQAMKATGTLTVSLELDECCEAPCATTTLQGGRFIRLTVNDTGVGIAPHLIDRIFDPFFTTKEIGVGTGLGLSLVHGIVTDLGGAIAVDSKLGEGATITVYFPWHSCAMPVQPVEEPITLGNGETVLLVDDEDALVRLGEEMIAELGYEPIGFTSSSAALAAFRAAPQRFDVLMTDEAMPEMTGSALIREIRRVRADIPIILMSGYVTSALAERAREHQVTEVLSKPLVSRDISRSLKNALQPIRNAGVAAVA